MREFYIDVSEHTGAYEVDDKFLAVVAYKRGGDR